ncbi:MAG: ATP-binding protein [Lachnospiraceae bacterium]|nr:ATP-binding protein [Lachnospiraceae bacterium]
MELRRKIYDKLCEWKHKSNGRSAILIEGARRVGKSYISKQFGENEYKSCIIVDFSLITDDLIDIFEHDINDFDFFFNRLAAYYGKRLYERDTLIIFDEVQLYPKARQLVKHLIAYGKYDILETGSLITLKKNIEDIVIPSEEEHISMYPLDFEEFLWSFGDEKGYDFVRMCYEKKIPLGDAIHRKMLSRFREYLLVGGMPQAVTMYIETKSFEETDKIKRRILRLYRDDVTKFARGYESKVLSVFDGIPSQLSKHEKKYKLSSISKSARFREYEDAFIWLDEAKVVLPCFNSNHPNIGLGLNEDATTLKCYMNDTGLLISHTFSENEITSEEVNKAFLFGKLNLNEGMFFENVVAQMLVSTGRKLYFYSRSDRDNSDNRMEVDFLIQNEKKISPIEVKSSSYQRHASLDKFKDKFNKRVGTRYVIYTKDLRIENDIMYMPVYMTLCV